jgi:phenylpropionate dioxygenase-like ring-hydroxylating dioxygenase large terminal subunit
MTFMLNTWYVCAWPDEISSDGILARTICDQPIIFYRGAGGTVAALEDRCCHRQMPLSMGWLEDDTVRCSYHGLRFNAEGKCVEIPGQENIPPRVTVRTYPVVEKYGAVWLWPGEADADPALIPEMFSPMDDPDWSFSGGTTYVKCNYQLISDNLLDLTHENYIHRTSLGNQAVVEHPITTEGGDDWVTVQRLIPEHDPAPFWKAALKDGKGLEDVLCDRWQVIHFQPPANLMLEVGVAPAGTGGLKGDRSRGVEGRNVNLITPETETTTHYFWGLARNFNRDPKLDPVFSQKVADIFEEDKGAVEAVQRVMDANPGRPVVDINADAGHVLARRMVERLVAAENQVPAAAE